MYELPIFDHDSSARQIIIFYKYSDDVIYFETLQKVTNDLKIC